MYVYDALLTKKLWVHRDWLWTHEHRLIEERYSDEGKLIMEWYR
jgi:hypothetical protein